VQAVKQDDKGTLRTVPMVFVDIADSVAAARLSPKSDTCKCWRQLTNSMTQAPALQFVALAIPVSAWWTTQTGAAQPEAQQAAGD
jgi:hypothetical protein